MRHPPPLLSCAEPGAALVPAAAMASTALLELPPAFALPPVPVFALPPPASLAFMVPAPPSAPPSGGASAGNDTSARTGSRDAVTRCYWGCAFAGHADKGFHVHSFCVAGEAVSLQQSAPSPEPARGRSRRARGARRRSALRRTVDVRSLFSRIHPPTGHSGRASSGAPYTPHSGACCDDAWIPESIAPFCGHCDPLRFRVR